ncbi:MAG: molybdenum cofactor guanylyltransferase [bacterium]
MTGIILAGGKGTRLGNRNKAFIKLGKFSIIENVIMRLKEASFKEIIICGGQTLNIQGLTPVEDIIPHKGPLAGVYSGLISSNSFYNFVVACDMPFLSINLIKYMKDKVGDADIVVPKTKKGIEPLHAIYSKNCMDIIKQKITCEKGKLSLRSIFSELKIKYVLEEEILKFSLPEIAFFNINTVEDIEKAKRLVKELEG